MLMTKEQERISAINHKKAVEYFGLDNMSLWEYCLHHKDPSWKYDDIERYIQWNPADLVVMEFGEHSKLHSKGKTVSEKTREKIREANIGKHLSEETKKKLSEAGKGKTKSDEWKKKISESNKGKHDHKGENNPNFGNHKHWKLNEDGKRIYY